MNREILSVVLIIEIENKILKNNRNKNWSCNGVYGAHLPE